MSVSLAKITGYTVTPARQSTHCAWCRDTATLAIKGPKPYDRTDLACEHHAVVHFGASIPKPAPRCGTCGGRGCNCQDTDRDWK